MNVQRSPSPVKKGLRNASAGGGSSGTDSDFDLDDSSLPGVDPERRAILFEPLSAKNSKRL